MANNIIDQLEKKEIYPLHRDGIDDGRWAVLDFGEVILHIFVDETRLIYALDKVWGTGKNISTFTDDGLVPKS
jgi:ribosome-associated protein